MELKNYRPIFVPALIIFLGTISLLALFPIQVKTLIKERRKIEMMEKEIEELKTKYLLVSSLDQETLKSQAGLALMALPEDKNVPYILQGVRQAVVNAGFVIKAMKFAPGEISKEGDEKRSKAKKRIEELPLELKIIGPYGKLLGMLESLETTLPLFRVESVEVIGSQKIKNRVNARLKLITFYSPPLPASPRDAIALSELILSEEESGLLEKLSQFKTPTVKVDSSPNQGAPTKPTGKGRENPFSFP